MKKNSFSRFSEERLSTCHPDLQRLFRAVLEVADCTILCGFRGEKEQNAAVASGASKAKWPTSSHNSQPSLAVDVMPCPLDWNNAQAIFAFSKIVKQKAKELGIVVYWGGDWVTFKDRPHWSLNGK